MNPIAILKEVEADVKAFGSISGDIRSTLKSGVADLTAIRDEMRALVEAVKSKAIGALASLKALADEVSKDAGGDVDGSADKGGDTLSDGQAPAQVVTTSPTGATVTVAATSTTHADPSTGVTTTLDHATGEATATDSSGAPVTPDPDAVAEANAAKAAAGEAIPAAPVI